MRVDVRVKFLLLFYANALLLWRKQGPFEWALVACLVLAFVVQDYGRKGLRFGVIFLALALFDAWVLDSLVGDASSLGSMVAVGGRLMLPCFMAGSLILSTTPASELIGTFRRLHIPEGVILTLAVMMRYLPTVRYEFRKIRQSLALRGLFPTAWSKVRSPLRYFEYCLIPLMLSAGRVAQDLTVATLTKGVGIVGAKTQFQSHRFGSLDYGFLLALGVQVICLGVGL